MKCSFSAEIPDNLSDLRINAENIVHTLTSIKRIQRINFLEIFEKVNGVEELLKQDPANVYEDMTNKTKELCIQSQ